MVRKVCSICGKEAIGMQIMECCTTLVCEEHADPMLRALKPGEIKVWGILCFQKFAEGHGDG